MRNSSNAFSMSNDTRRFLIKNQSMEMSSLNFDNNQSSHRMSQKNNFLSFSSQSSGNEKLVDVPINPFEVEKNLLWLVDKEKNEHIGDFFGLNLEDILIDNFKKMNYTPSKQTKFDFKSKKDVALKVKNDENENLESTILYEGEVNQDLQMVLNEYGDKTHFYKIIPRKKINTKNYNEMVIDTILKKYKPKILDEDSEEQKTEEKVDQNLIEMREFFSKNSNHSYFLHEMKELDRSITDIISRNEFLAEEENDDEQVKLKPKAGSEESLYNELQSLNPENSLLKLIVFKIFKYRVDLKFVKWKINLLNLISKWKYEKDYLPVSKQKMNIKYLKAKFIITKIIRNKQKGSLGNQMTIESFLHGSLVNNANRNNDSYLFDVLPIFTYLEYDGYMIMYDIITDIQVLYFMIISPMIIVLKLNSPTFNTISLLFNGVYFFNILRKFRRLRSSETGSAKKNINKLFWTVAKDLKIVLGILSLLPFISFFSNITRGEVSESYNLLILAPVIRVIDFGKSIEFLEKTKYAMRIRLILLILRFIIFAHWLGLIFYRYIQFDYFSSEYKLEASCFTVYFGLNDMLSKCIYVIALMDGTYLIPGSYMNGMKYMDDLSFSTSDYFLLFLVYFIGQIIVAYVFGGVTDLIKNLNQASNIYREKTDSIKSFMIGYDFDKAFQEKVTNYYVYLKDKKRNLLYGKDLLSNISDTLKVKLNEEILPYTRFILKDFYGISKEKEKKFLASVITHLKECVAYPGEKVYTQGEVIKGLFIIIDGSLFFTDDTNKLQAANEEGGDEKEEITMRYDFNNKFTVDRKNCMQKILLNKKFNIKDPILDYKTETIFPWDSIFFKTGRAIETSYVENFTDLYLLETKFFDTKLIVNFPDEMNILLQKAKKIGLLKIGQNLRIQELVFKHSARSVETYYEESFDLNNIWIEIRVKNHVAGQKKLETEVEDPSFGLFELNFKTKINVL